MTITKILLYTLNELFPENGLQSLFKVLKEQKFPTANNIQTVIHAEQSLS